MDTINTFFADLGAKMPFATDFFKNNLKVGSFEINTLFLLLVAAVIVIIALVVIIACSCKAAKAKKAIKAKRQAPAVDEAPKQDSDTLEAVAAEEEPKAEEAPVAEESEAEVAAPAEEPQEEIKAEEPAEAKAEEPAAAPAEEAKVEEAPVEEPAETKAEEPAAAPVEEAAEPKAEEAAEETPVAEEAVAVEAPAAEPKAEAAADEAAPQTEEKTVDKPVVAKEEKNMKEDNKKETKAAPAKKALVGTFEVSLCIDGYRFCLYASNKQLMYESVGFTSSDGAMKGIETFRKTLQETPYVITHDKYGHYRYVFNKRYQGENYTTAAQAQSAAESVKRWAENAKVILRNPKPEEKEAYKKALDSLRTKDDVDWDEVARVEAKERKMGKFTVEEDGNQDEVIGYRFYLIANNAQILYTSAIYTSAAGALKAIDTFKRAVYIGNFYVDEDKFGRYRYILRATATTTYVGESYATRASAENSIESVKKFVKCATIVPFKKEAE